MIAQLDVKYIRKFPNRTIVRFLSYLLEGRPLTTKGRWINKLLIILFRGLCSINYSRSFNYISIIGLGRGGSTILGKILSIEDNVMWLNEPKLPWYVISKKDDIIGNYTREIEHSRLVRQHAPTKIEIQRAVRLFSFFSLFTNSNVIVDKYPEMIYRKKWLSTIFPNHKSIVVMRHPYKLASSIKRWNDRNAIIQDTTQENWWGFSDYKWNILVDQVVNASPLLNTEIEKIRFIDDDIQRGLIEWICVAEEALNWNNALVVRLEDLQENPGKQIKLIYDYTNFNFNERKYNYLMKIIESKSDYNPVEVPTFLDRKLKYLMKIYNYET